MSGREQVAEALAHARAGLEDGDAALREDIGDGRRVVDLRRPPAEAGQPVGQPGRGAARSIELRAPSIRLHRQCRGPVGSGRRRRNWRRLVGRGRARVEDGQGGPGDPLQQPPLVRGEAGGPSCEPGQDLRGRLGVGQGATRRPREAELLDEDRQGVSVKLGVEQERRLQRVEPVAGERRDLGAPGRLAEMVPVEGGVVGHQQGVAGELLQAGQRRGGGRSPVEVCVGDAGPAA